MGKHGDRIGSLMRNLAGRMPETAVGKRLKRLYGMGIVGHQEKTSESRIERLGRKCTRSPGYLAITP